MASISLQVFSLVLLSACLHALWNVAARKVKGDLYVLILGNFVFVVALTCPVFLVPLKGDLLTALPYIVITGVVHALYVWSLGAMYSHAGGSISIVYPVARGTGVALTAVLAVPLLGEHVSITGAVGIGSMILGVFGMGIASNYKKAPEQEVSLNSYVSLEEGEDDVFASQFSAGLRCTSDKEGTELGPLQGAVLGDEEETGGAVCTGPEMGEQDQPGRDRSQGATAKQTDRDDSELMRGPPSRIVLPKFGAVWLALLTGFFICVYSINDKMGVDIIHPVVYIWGGSIVELAIYAVWVLASGERRKECMAAWREKQRYIWIIGIGAHVTYLIILFVFTMSSASYVVALRESAVVFGAIFGVVLLGEHVSIPLIIGTCFITAGLVLIKLA